MKLLAVSRAGFIEPLENRRLLAADLTLAANFRGAPVDPGSSFAATIVLNNQGNDPAGAFDVSLALSESGKFGDADNIPLTSFSQTSGLPAHRSVRVGATALVVPGNAPVGSYHLVGKIDVSDSVAESNEKNNVFSSRKLIQVGPVVSIVARQLIVNPAGPSVRLTITRSGGSGLASDLTVSYSVTGTAVAGTDFVALPGTVTIPAGRRSALITLTPISHSTLSLENTTVTIALSPAAGYNVSAVPGRASTTLIIDNRAALLNAGALIIPGETTSTILITPAISPLSFTSTARTSTLGVPTTFQSGTPFLAFNGNITSASQLGMVSIDSFTTLTRPFVLTAGTPFFFIPIRSVLRPPFTSSTFVAFGSSGIAFSIKTGDDHSSSFFFFSSTFSTIPTSNSSLGLMRTYISDPLSFTPPVFT